MDEEVPEGRGSRMKDGRAGPSLHVQLLAPTLGFDFHFALCP